MIRHLLIPPVPVVLHIVAPNVEPDVNVLLRTDVAQAECALRHFPSALPDDDHRLVVVVQADKRVVRRNAGEVIHRGIGVHQLIHVAGEAVFAGVNAAERQQTVERLREAEIQVCRVRRAQGAAERNDARRAVPAVAVVRHGLDERRNLPHDVVHPRFMAAVAEYVSLSSVSMEKTMHCPDSIHGAHASVMR